MKNTKSNAQDYVISVDNLTKTFKTVQKNNLLRDIFFPQYKNVEAVKNLDIKIRANENVAFLGPNGAGKTTTIKMLTGLIYPTSGKIRVLGFNPQDRKHEFLKKIGLVMGNKGILNWDLTALQSLRLVKDIYFIPDLQYEKRLKKYTEMFNVTHVLNTQVRKLSLGERMKLELVSVLLYNPSVLFLDEPTIGLDVVAKQNIRTLLRNLVKTEKITLLLTSHDMDDIEAVCDRVIIISKGTKIFDGDLRTLKNTYSNTKFVRVVTKSVLLPATLKKIKTRVKYVNRKSNFELTAEIPKNQVGEQIAYLFKSLNIADIDITERPLDLIIADIFKKEGRK